MRNRVFKSGLRSDFKQQHLDCPVSHVKKQFALPASSYARRIQGKLPSRESKVIFCQIWRRFGSTFFVAKKGAVHRETWFGRPQIFPVITLCDTPVASDSIEGSTVIGSARQRFNFVSSDHSPVTNGWDDNRFRWGRD